MANEKELSVLSLYVYKADSRNTALLPTGWVEIAPRTQGNFGFAYAVFQGPGGEIVISYRGSDDGVDWLTNGGLSISQERQAAQIAAQYINQGLNVTFTGHSLGGGLAATMAVWFNRPAIVFDPAPTQAVVTDLFVVNSVIDLLGDANAPQSIHDYAAAVGTQFAIRESNVVSYFAPGSALTSIRNEGNTITGPGQATPVQFGIDNMTSLIDQKNMHSQALLTAGLLSSAIV